MPGHGAVPRVENGPPLAGRGAEAVRDAVVAAITAMPMQLRRSLTWDQGAETARHAELRIAARSARPRLRSAEPLAARHRRDPQRAPASAPPQGHGPHPSRTRPSRTQPSRTRRTRGRRHHPRRPAPKDPGLAHARPGARRAADDRSRRPRRVRPLETARHACEPCREALAGAKITPSMSRKGSCLDGAPMESGSCPSMRCNFGCGPGPSDQAASGVIWSVEPSSSWGVSSSAMPSICMYRCLSCQSSFCSSSTAPTRRVMLSSLGKMACHVGAPLDLLVQPLEGVGGVQLGAVAHGEGHVGQDIGLGVVHQRAELRPSGAELIGDVAPGSGRGGVVGLNEGLPDGGRDDGGLAARDVRERIPHEVHAGAVEEVGGS